MTARNTVYKKWQREGKEGGSLYYQDKRTKFAAVLPQIVTQKNSVH